MIFTFLAILAVAFEAQAQSRNLGILKQLAPSFNVKNWIQLPKGQSALDIDSLKGKVVYLYCFQSWCPGCHSHGFPTLQKLVKHYQDNPRVIFVGVQTTFEGFTTNTFSKLKETAEKYDLNIPFGQSGSEQERSTLMQQYRTGGTPWSVIIDKKGIVQFNNFHIKPDDAITIIESL